jgi:hypothetical protein
VNIKLPTPGWYSKVELGIRVGKTVGVSVEGNQIFVGVGVSGENCVGDPLGVVRTEQPAKTSPKAARSWVKIRGLRMVSFIVSKTGGIVAQDVVQSNQPLNSACHYLHSTACTLNLAIRKAFDILMIDQIFIVDFRNLRGLRNLRSRNISESAKRSRRTI